MADEKRAPKLGRQIWFSLGGIVIGLAFAGLIALFINNVIQPTMQIETQGLVTYSGDRFKLWFHEESELPSERNALFGELEGALDSLLVRLDVDESLIPLPIDVIVHDTPGELQSSILRRKSSNATYTFYSMMDLVYGEDPYERLCELVLAFGWGQTWSQLLYTGVLLNLTQPDRDFHESVAAAPERLRTSLEGLLRLESTGLFPETLYQMYDSPYSPRMAIGSLDRLVAFFEMAETLGFGEVEYGLVELEAASLVQHVLEVTGGWEAIEAAWGPGLTEVVLTTIVREPVPVLTENWSAAVNAVAGSGPEYDYQCARFLFEAGSFADAFDISSTWDASQLEPTARQLAIRTALAVGDLARAETLAQNGDQAEQETYEDWIAVYAGWQTEDQGNVRLHTSPQAAVSLDLEGVEQALRTILDELVLDTSDLPPRISVFVYDTEEARNLGESIIPTAPPHQTLWHLAPSDDLVEQMSRSLPSYAYGQHTASSLLRSGIASALINDFESLRSAGCEMYLGGEWTALWQLGFGGTPKRFLDVEAGLMIRYILDRFGGEVIRDLWVSTSRSGQGMSFDSALSASIDMSRHDIEQELLGMVLQCER